MLECRGRKIYTGIALDVAARFALHCAGKGAAYTRAFPPRRILGARPCGSLSQALKLEAALKRLQPAEKRAWARAARPSARNKLLPKANTSPG